MRKYLLHTLTFGAAMLTAASLAHADCVQDLDTFEASFDERLKDEEGRAAAHPLIVKMSDGKLVDMREQDPDGKPKERWFVTDKDAVDNVRSGISEARQAFGSGDTAGCESRYNELQTLVN